jgi:ATPase subunit of ABC transporter with duplicated ATPase domains
MSALLTLDAVTLATPDGRPLLSDLTLSFGREHTGPNGAGKTTLLLLAAALLDQHVGLLDPRRTILDNLRRLNPALTDNAARAALARFAFRNVTALRKAGELSGGERLRAGLACLLSAERPPSLLLLDEPTNHLDLDSIEVLEAALAGFDGALLVASHDEAFLEQLGIGRVIALGQTP